jgi:hypothetical protein
MLVQGRQKAVLKHCEVACGVHSGWLSMFFNKERTNNGLGGNGTPNHDMWGVFLLRAHDSRILLPPDAAVLTVHHSTQVEDCLIAHKKVAEESRPLKFGQQPPAKRHPLRLISPLLLLVHLDFVRKQPESSAENPLDRAP